MPEYQTRAYDNTLDFHGLHICKEELLPEIIAGVDQSLLGIPMQELEDLKHKTKKTDAENEIV